MRFSTGKLPQDARLSNTTLEEIDARDLERRLEEARRAGYREGHDEAVRGAAQRLAEETEKLEAAREEAEADLSRIAIELAVSIAGDVLAREIDEGRYDIERMVREALSWSGVGRGNCTVHLHPEDVARLDGIPFRAGTTIEADPDVELANVHITTPQGLLVRELDEVLVAIREALLEEQS